MPSSSFPDEACALSVLELLRRNSIEEAISLLLYLLNRGHSGLLLSELYARLIGNSSPHIVIDSHWLASPFGGISRVWHQILSTYTLPGLFSSRSQLTLIDRGMKLPFRHDFRTVPATIFNSSDPASHLSSSYENGKIVSALNADCFVSSSNTTVIGVKCKQIALVHDCMPEHFTPFDQSLLSRRRDWIHSSNRFLCVSQNTRNDLIHFYNVQSDHAFWCYPSPSLLFASPLSGDVSSIASFVRSLDAPFFFLPSPGALHSYKNIGVVASAFKSLGNLNHHLVLSGVNASLYCQQLESEFSLDRTRLHAVGATDSELQYLYRSAACVILPSLMEGFGMPVVEALACDGLVFVADSPGLVESASNAALRFKPNDSAHLALLLQLSSHPSSRSWLQSTISNRRESRLSSLNPDLLGLALLSLCRSS